MRVYLNCSFHEKDKVKALGARFDGQKKQWYIENIKDTTVFSAWIPTEKMGQSEVIKNKSSKAKEKPLNKDKLIEKEYVQFCCSCDVLPWEPCVHTPEYEAFLASKNALLIKSN